jgi:hypothetical protein
MPTFTITTQFLLPMYKHFAITADLSFVPA